MINGKPILPLWIFGVAMAFGAVVHFTNEFEPLFWLIVLASCAMAILTKNGKLVLSPSSIPKIVLTPYIIK